jgi:adenine/guanine phosphoribosyltransferase-like PRPP-binding protein
MRWKGLHTDTMPLFLGYDQIERMIAALLDRAAEWQPNLVVGIARGGLVPATMAAGIMALPLAMVKYDRNVDMMAWIGETPVHQRILLVDDGCSTGGTMAAVRQSLLQDGHECLTLAVVYDPDGTQYVPDLSHPMRSLWRFPWERGEATPAGRALRATGAGPDRATELPFYGVEFDSIIVSQETNGGSLPGPEETFNPLSKRPVVSIERTVLITGRPESDREAIVKWLTRWGHGDVPLECRPPGIPSQLALIAHYKAETATRWGCTHFIESNVEQAVRIAARAPHLLVSWWSAAEAKAWVVGASADLTLHRGGESGIDEERL